MRYKSKANKVALGYGKTNPIGVQGDKGLEKYLAKLSYKYGKIRFCVLSKTINYKYDRIIKVYTIGVINDTKPKLIRYKLYFNLCAVCNDINAPEDFYYNYKLFEPKIKVWG